MKAALSNAFGEPRKMKGTNAMHDNSLSGKSIPAAAKVILKNAKVLAGDGIVENSRDENLFDKRP